MSPFKMRLPLLLAVALSHSAAIGPRSICVESFTFPRIIAHRRTPQLGKKYASDSAPFALLRAVQYGAESGGDTAAAAASYPPPSRRKNRTLYDVLRCPPDATRDELKRQYVALARESHPDSLIGRDSRRDDPDRPDFNEVARAWKLLSDPRERRRYDRSLRAERFTEEVERLAADAATGAVPRVQRMLERLAVPLVRRTAATAAAGIEAAARDISAGAAEAGGVDLGSALASAVRASRRAGRAVDRMELLEKSSELNGRAEEETAKAESLKDELVAVVEERLRIALRTPHSDLSSGEALKILDGFNTLDSVSRVESVVLLRRTLAAEIETLEDAEREYYDRYDAKTAAERELEEQREALRTAEINAAAALEAERRAQEALDAARDLVSSSRRAASKCGASVASLEETLERTEADAARVAQVLERRRERVRAALRRKEDALRAERNRVKRNGEVIAAVNSTKGAIHANGVNGGDAARGAEDEARALAQINMAQLEELRKKERFLTAESTRLESRAIRLQSRARKLMNRANGLNADGTLPPSSSSLHPQLR